MAISNRMRGISRLVNLTAEQREILENYPRFFYYISSEYIVKWIIERNIIKYFSKEYRSEILDGSHTDTEVTIVDKYYEKKTFIWKNDKGQLHREDNYPAIVHYNGSMEWYIDGKPSNYTGPSRIIMDDQKLCSLYYNDAFYLNNFSISFKINKTIA